MSGTSALSSLSSLSLHNHTSRVPLFSAKPTSISFFSLLQKPSSLAAVTTVKSASDDIDTSFFDNVNPETDEIIFGPPSPPEGFVAPPYFDEGPEEAEEDIAAAYEELYGPAYSGETLVGNDIYVMDSKVKKSSSGGGIGGKAKKEKARDGFEERVIQVRRVTKVVKGGKQSKFRAVVVVGDKQGNVGVDEGFNLLSLLNT